MIKKTDVPDVLWIGFSTDREDQLYPEKNLKWVKDKVKTLGLWISTNLITSRNANYNEEEYLKINLGVFIQY